MATPITLPTNQTIGQPAAQRVYSRGQWNSTWTRVPYLHCVQMTRSCAPEIPQATLVWRFGFGTQAGQSPPAARIWPRLGFVDRITTVTDQTVANGTIGRFLRIEFDVPGTGSDPQQNPLRTVRWDGFVVDSDEERFGPYLQRDEDGNVTKFPAGVQTLTAVGLEYLLAERTIETSVVEKGDGGVERIRRAISFNGYKGTIDRDGQWALVGNRSADPVGGVYVFARTLSTQTEDVSAWNAQQIVEYLLKWHAIAGKPDSLLDPAHVPCEVVTGSLIDAMAWERPVVACEGRSTWDVLNEVINRRRSLAFWLAVDASDPANEKLKLHVATYNDQAIVLTDEVTGIVETIPANPNPRSFDVDTSLLVDGMVVRRSSTVVCDQVVVRGDRRRSVFTLSKMDGTLEEDWGGSAWHDLYNQGASTAGDYPAGDAAKRHERNRLVRESDRLRRVYRYFKLPTGWDGRVKNGENGGTAKPACPQLDTAGEPSDEVEPHWWPGLRLERQLPLLKNWKYTDNVAEPTDETPASPDGSQAEWLEPFACFKLPADGSGTTRWGLGEKLPLSKRVRKYADLQSDFGVSLRPQDQAAGLVLDVHGGPQHMIAKTEFAPLSGAGDEDGIFDWQSELLCTVSAQFDDYCEARYPTDVEVILATNRLLRRLVIDAGSRYRLDYVAPQTVLAIADGVLQRSAAGGFARDDRPRLAAIARLAYEWYRRERVALEFSVQALTDAFELGHLITELGSAETAETVNTLITSVTWEFGLSVGDPVRTIVRTNYAEIDLIGLGGGRAARLA